MAVNINESTTLKGNLYALPDSRIKLYGVLNSLITSSHALCPPPVQYAAIIFSMVQVRDTNPAVRELCANYLRGIEKILHPQKEILYFQAELREVRDALKDIHVAFKGDIDEDPMDDEQVCIFVIFKKL